MCRLSALMKRSSKAGRLKHNGSIWMNIETHNSQSIGGNRSENTFFSECRFLIMEECIARSVVVFHFASDSWDATRKVISLRIFEVK